MAGIVRADTFRMNTIKSQDSDVTALNINTDGTVSRSVVPSWQLRPDSASNVTMPSGNTCIGWSTTDGGYGLAGKGLHLSGGCTLSGASGHTNNRMNAENTGRLTVPTAGLYKMWTTIRIENSPTAGNIYLFINGTQFARQHVELWAHRNYSHGFHSHVLDLAADDYIEVIVTCSGGNVSGRNDNVNWFSGYMIG